MQWSWKESNGLERTIYVPYFDCIAYIINKMGVMVLKEFQDTLLFAVFWPYQAKMAEYAGDLT